MTTRHRPGRRVILAGLGWVVTAVILRAVVLQPEMCPAVSRAETHDAAVAAVGWLTRNQLDDGRWLYRYDRAEGVDLGGYNDTRHAGVTMSLYQASSRLSVGADAAIAAADRGARWALAHLVPAADGVAFGRGTRIPVGSTALLVAGLVERAGSPSDGDAADVVDDEGLLAMGRFLAAAVEPSGAVLATWDAVSGEFVADEYSVFFTGETFWALSRLGSMFPGEGFDEVADRVSRYVATERADVEDPFPPVSDHWAAYGLAELDARRALDDAEDAYVDRLATIFGPQVRYESQRGTGNWTQLTRGRRTLGAGLGTLGEGFANLSLVRADDAAIRERTSCVAGMLVQRQADRDEAADHADPARVEGAWFQFDITQMDDQQHALSALVLTLPLLDGESDAP